MPTDLNVRYGLNPAHSEVVEACQIIAQTPCPVNFPFAYDDSAL